MKRPRTVVYVLFAVFLASVTTQAQSVALPPQAQDEVKKLMDQLRETERAYTVQLRAGFPQGATGAWWTNRVVTDSLGLSADQKTKLERAYENHRQRIVSSTELLEKEEAQLARLLAAEPLDRNAVLTQIDRVVQARGEVERSNSAMTMEMRETLTRAQWLQLHPERTRVGANILSGSIGNLVEPVYPEAAKQAGIQGVVTLEVDISREGNVEAVRTLSGPSQLIQSAVDAVKQWRFRPTLLNGAPLPVVGIVNVSFPFVAPGLRGGGGRGGRGTPTAVPGPDGAGQRRGGRGGPPPQ
jgi:TonB family protein